MHLKQKIKRMSVWFLSSLVEGLFLAIWAFVQVLIDQALSDLQLPWVDSRLLVAMQLLFAIATLLPILIHIGVKISRCFTEASILIQKELEEVRVTSEIERR